MKVKYLNNLEIDPTEIKEAEIEFFQQMNIAEESVQTEGAITSAELRASLGISAPHS